MTNHPYRALVAAVSLLIGTVSGCAPRPLPTTVMTMRTQAAPEAQPCSSEQYAKDHPVAQAEAEKPAPSDSDKQMQQQYAKGFTAGYTDAVHARISADERRATRRLRAARQASASDGRAVAAR